MKFQLKLSLFYCVFVPLIKCSDIQQFCTKDNSENCQNYDKSHNFRYLLYDVNPPEGFNLRRDVYIRIAVFANTLKKSSNVALNNFKIVLPPWINLYHWNHDDYDKYFTWGHFFDVKSLQKFTPVVEMFEFFNEIGNNYAKNKIDEVYVLQNFEDMFETGNFEDRYEITPCNKKISVKFYGYKNLTSDNIKCLLFHGYMSQLTKILEKSKARTILFHHAEIPLHDHYGSKEYWEARRSMRFNKQLYALANEFRAQKLNSTDINDNTIRPKDWTKEKAQRNAKGGPYLSVHLRRKDFLWGRPDQVPSIENAAKQIKKILHKQDLKTVFISTDAPNEEYKQLKDQLTKHNFKVLRYENSKRKLNSGELAIVDQIICAHAQYFLGTHESTFSFRIQEEREILGFSTSSTFNRLCGDKTICDKPSMWKIIF